MNILKPPKHIFRNEHIQTREEQGLKAQKNVLFIAEKIDFTDRGILIYYEGCKYPSKGWPTADNLVACNTVKRIIMSIVLPLADKDLIIPFLLVRNKKKKINKFLAEQKYVFYAVLNPFFYKDEYYCIFCKEFRKLMQTFLKEIGVEDISKEFIHLLESDDAYRLRIQDIFSETNKESLLKNPKKEIQRLFNIYSARETQGIQYKFKAFAKLASLMFYIPSIKKSFIKAVSESNFENLQLDEADKYHCLLKSGYNFMGRTYEDREAEWTRIHKKLPPQIILN